MINIEESREVDEIINEEMAPKTSKQKYDQEWKRFLDFSKTDSPCENHYLQYFDTLRRVKNYKASTLWTIYSILNSNHQMRVGGKLQQWPRITKLLKGYNKGYQRKVAKVFTLNQVKEFMRMDLPTPFWTLRKAFVSIAFSGGLRCDEMHKLKIGDIEENPEGFVLTFQRSKQTGEMIKDCILVPYDKSDPSACFATKVSAYLQMIRSILGDIEKDSSLWKGCFGGKRLVSQPMGINIMRKIGQDVATILSLEDASSYTGHCWRRSAATQAAAAGATSVDLKTTFGWKQDTTAMKYLDKSANQRNKMASMITGSKVLLPEEIQVEHLVQGSKSVSASAFPVQNITYNINLGANCSNNSFSLGKPMD